MRRARPDAEPTSMGCGNAALRMATARRTLAALAAVLLLALPVSAAGNLLENPSFDQAGEDPIPWWTIRGVASRTSIRAEAGSLVLERKEGGGDFADSCLQTVNLPPGTYAVRIRVRAGWSDAERAEVALTFQARDGRALASKVAFLLRRNSPVRWLDRDVPLPEGTRDLTVAVSMRGKGRLVVEQMEVTATDPAGVRPEARIVAVRAEIPVPSQIEGPVRIPIPPPTPTQAPLSVTVSGVMEGARIEIEEERAFLVTELAPGGADRTVQLDARVLLTEREDLREAPGQLPVTPARHLNRRLAPYAEEVHDARVPRVAERLGPADDLRELARQIAEVLPKDVGAVERAELAVALLRTREVPAREVAILRVDRPSGEAAVAAYEKERGWLLFGLSPEDPRPLAFLDTVLLLAALPDGEPRLADLLPASAAEIGSFVIPKKTSDDLVAGLAAAFRKAARSLRVESGTATARVLEPELRGPVKKLEADLAPFLGD